MKPFPFILRFVIISLLCGSYHHVNAQYSKGADVSWLPQMEASGYVFYNRSGVQSDVLTILKDYEINTISLRVWVNPSNNAANGHCSIAETVTFAQRIVAAGYRLSVCCHYGDSWNSVEEQNTPAAWKNMTYSAMKTALAHHVDSLMSSLKKAGITPEWFKNGNETNLGVCLPTGDVSTNPAQMVGLFNAGYDAAKTVFPSIKVMIHCGQPQLAPAKTFYDAFVANGGKWDILALSSYASLANEPWVYSCVDTLQKRYNKPVMMVETGGNWTDSTNMKACIAKWVKDINSLGSNGLGVWYWEPEGYNWNSYLMGAWNPNTKKPTIALEGFLSAVPIAENTPDVVQIPRNVYLKTAFNPYCGGLLCLEINNIPGAKTISILDLQGTVVSDLKVKEDKIGISPNLKPGTYFIKVSNGPTTGADKFVVH